MGDLRDRAEQAGSEAVEAGRRAALPAGQWAPPTPEENGQAVAGLPDVADSPIAAELDVPVHVAWSRVMGDVQWIAKASQADKYKFRGIDAVRNAVGPALRKHGVTVLPVSTRVDHERNSRSGGGSMTTSWATVQYAIFGPRGDRFGGPEFVVETVGEGFDVSDKSTMKAESVAERTLYIVGLCIPTNQPEMDPEHGPQYEIGGPRKPTAAEYMALILDERTSLDRLSQIKAELDSDRPTGATEMELADGEKIRLVDLVRRVGRERKGA